MKSSFQFPPEINQLEAYLRHTPGIDFTLRMVENEEGLDKEFSSMRQRFYQKMSDLERRLELCASFHRDTESKLDCSRSRIKVERNGLSIERYEDLLGHNFREIEWTNTSRVKMDPESKERTASIDRVEQSIDALEAELLQTSKRQEDAMQAFEEAGEREATELEAAMDRQTQDLDNHFSDLQRLLSQSEAQFEAGVSELGSCLSESSKHLASLLTSSVQGIERTVSS